MSVSKSTVKRDLEVIRRLFTLAIKWKKYKGENPVKLAGIDRIKPKPRKVWTDEQQRIIFASDKPEYVRIWKTIRLTGMRAGEVIKLLKRNVDLEKGLIRLTAEDTKEGKPKTIIMDKELKRIFSEAMENNDTEYVFLSTKGKPFKSPQGPMRVLKKLARQYGLGDIDQHSLRHTFASKLVEIVDINTLRDILGHSDLRTTMIYLHSQHENKKRAAELAEDQLNQIVETKTATNKKRTTRNTA